MEEKSKKQFYKKWWFWLIIILIIFALGSGNSSTNNTTNTDETINSNTQIYTKNTELETLLNNMTGYDAYRSNVSVKASDTEVVVSYTVDKALTNEILLKVIFNDYCNYAKKVFNNYDKYAKVTFNIKGTLLNNDTHNINLSISKSKFDSLVLTENESIYDLLEKNCDKFDISNITNIDKSKIYYTSED